MQHTCPPGQPGGLVVAIVIGPLAGSVRQKYKGVVDFYYVGNQLRARAWPRNPKQPNSPGQRKQKAFFKEAIEWQKTNPREHKLQWLTMTDPTKYGIRSLQRTMAIKGAQESIFTRPPIVLSQTIDYVESPDQTTVTIELQDYDGWDDKEVEFFAKEYLGEFNHLITEPRADQRMIDGKPKAQKVPIINDYLPPDSVDVSMGGTRIKLEFARLMPGVSWFCRAKGITDEFVMLSPLYDQGHRPPGPVRPYYPFPGDPPFPPFFPAVT